MPLRAAVAESSHKQAVPGEMLPLPHGPGLAFKNGPHELPASWWEGELMGLSFPPRKSAPFSPWFTWAVCVGGLGAYTSWAGLLVNNLMKEGRRGSFLHLADCP